MMALRRTPLLPPGWGLGRPSCSGIGASSVVRAAVSSAGMLLAGGRRSVLAQTGFCQLMFGRVSLCSRSPLLFLVRSVDSARDFPTE